MNHVIIFEGPDNLGKTYLIDSIKNNTNPEQTFPEFTPVHFGAVKNIKEARSVMKKTLFDLRIVNNANLLFDRSPFGDMVYGYYRKYDPYSYWDDVKEWMTELSLTTKFLFIVFDADPFTYMQFGLKPKCDEKKAYQKAADASLLSERFKIVAKRLVEDCSNVQSMLVKCNEYPSLDQRNKRICGVIDRWLDGNVLVREII